MRCGSRGWMGVVVVGSWIAMAGCKDDPPAENPTGPGASHAAPAASTDATEKNGATKPGDTAIAAASDAGDSSAAADTAKVAAAAQAASTRELVPSGKECKAALASVIRFADTMGQKAPSDTEKEEFLLQCTMWPRPAVVCLAAAVKPPEIIHCMKPIAQAEMKKGVQSARESAAAASTAEQKEAMKAAVERQKKKESGASESVAE